MQYDLAGETMMLGCVSADNDGAERPLTGRWGEMCSTHLDMILPIAGKVHTLALTSETDTHGQTNHSSLI